MMDFLKRLFKLLLAVCILVAVLYIINPAGLPPKVRELLDHGADSVKALWAENVDLPELERWEQNAVSFAGLEQIRSVGDFIAEDIAGRLEDTGITGEEYTFDTTYYPYYGMLSETEQSVYRQIYANVTKFHTTFVPGWFVTTEEVSNAISAVYYDHPELFWLEPSYSFRYNSSGMCAQIIMEFNQSYDKIEESTALFHARADAIIQAAAALENDYEKEKYVHDALVETVEYNLLAELNQSAYSALVGGETVCAGYARAFQYIMLELGIPTYYCVGYSEGDHAWNIVKLEDGFYNVDVTADDGTASYHYFNCTDAEFSESHTRTELSVYLPACNAAG